MTDILWEDRFTVSHFTDRYDLRGGVEGGTFTTSPDGLKADWVAWDDATNALGEFQLVIIEMDFVSWAGSSHNIFIGFRPPGAPAPFSGTDGLWLNSAGASAQQVWTERDHSSAVADFFVALDPYPSNALLTMRLTIDRFGVVMYGIAAGLETGGVFRPGGGAAKSIGGYAKLSPEVMAGLPNCVPFSQVAANQDTQVVKRWSYAICGIDQRVPSDIQAQQAIGGVVTAVPVAVGGNAPGHGAIP